MQSNEGKFIGLNSGRLSWPLIVHSHLNWDWVWQRPQQFISRLSRRHRVLFIEGPVPSHETETPTITRRDVPEFPNLSIVQTRIPARRWSDEDFVDAERLRLVQSLLEGPLAAEFREPVQWFYDPMAVTAFADKMNERAIVYDCMDELSQFKDAPTRLRERERELLELADVVFAGGPRIGEEKCKSHANCHVFGCGVDLHHFAAANHLSTRIAPDVSRISPPLLGYVGVVDERIDYELIDRLSIARPDWNLVMIGPSTKVDPAIFPRRENIHWLGARDYAALPSYLKAFAVCLMPFALNSATEFLNPTKALEYMATGRPIVSTAIGDVVRQYSGIVAIGRTHEEFIAHCERLVASPDHAALQRGLVLASSHSWDGVVSKMEQHIEDALASLNESAA